MRPTAPPIPRERALRAREHAQAFLDTREDQLIAEVWERGSIREKLEVWRFLKGYAHGIVRAPADMSYTGSSFEDVMREVEATREAKERAGAITTTVETVSVTLLPAAPDIDGA
ncbi:MAG: hypothetical protein ABI592_01110 [Acidobacteriota bacterium]